MILYGASGHGKVIAEILAANNIVDIEFWDDNPESKIWNIEISKPVFANTPQNKYMIISIGNNYIRKTIADKTSPYFNYADAIHPRSVVSSRAAVSPGSVIMAGAVVNTDVILGVHTIVNSSAVIEHDCILADFVHISPNAALAGDVQIGEGTHIGIGACVIQGITVGKWATIGAGAVIIENVPDYAVVVGNPGRIIKYNPTRS